MNNWRQILSWQVVVYPAVLLYFPDGSYVLLDEDASTPEKLFHTREVTMNYLQKYYHFSPDRAELIIRDAKEFGSCEF